MSQLPQPRSILILRGEKRTDMGLPADQLPIGRGINPLAPGDTCLFYVSRTILESIEENGPEAKWHDANLLEDAIAQPAVIFHGLNRQGFEDGYCFSCLPQFRFRSDGTTMPRRADRVFLLYMTLEVGPVIFDWEWRPGNEKTGHPYEARENFGRETWRRT